MLQFVIVAITVLLAAGAAADTLETVRARGVLECGASPSLAGIQRGQRQRRTGRGSKTTIARALAAAIFGEPAKVKFTVLPPRDVFTVLQSGAIDIFAGPFNPNVLAGRFPRRRISAVYLYDGQGFMVTKKSGIKSVQELNGASICLTQDPPANSASQIISVQTR